MSETPEAEADLTADPINPDEIALGTLDALQTEVNATIDGLKATYLLNSRMVPVQPAQWLEDAANGDKRCLPAGEFQPASGDEIYNNPGFEDAVRLAVALVRQLKQNKLEGLVINGLGFIEPPTKPKADGHDELSGTPHFGDKVNP